MRCSENEFRCGGNDSGRVAVRCMSDTPANRWLNMTEMDKNHGSTITYLVRAYMPGKLQDRHLREIVSPYMLCR
jgi:hypothetical protein